MSPVQTRHAALECRFCSEMETDFRCVCGCVHGGTIPETLRCTFGCKCGRATSLKCHWCSKWQHFSCLKFEATLSQIKGGRYVCPWCARKHHVGLEFTSPFYKPIDHTENEDECAECGVGGDLLCCDGCPASYHLKCAGVDEVPSGRWECKDCVRMVKTTRKVRTLRLPGPSKEVIKKHEDRVQATSQTSTNHRQNGASSPSPLKHKSGHTKHTASSSHASSSPAPTTSSAQHIKQSPSSAASSSSSLCTQRRPSTSYKDLLLTQDEKEEDMENGGFESDSEDGEEEEEEEEGEEAETSDEGTGSESDENTVADGADGTENPKRKSKQLFYLSHPLGELLGETRMTANATIRTVWRYIHLHQLRGIGRVRFNAELSKVFRQKFCKPARIVDLVMSHLFTDPAHPKRANPSGRVRTRPERKKKKTNDGKQDSAKSESKSSSSSHKKRKPVPTRPDVAESEAAKKKQKQGPEPRHHDDNTEGEKNGVCVHRRKLDVELAAEDNFVMSMYEFGVRSNLNESDMRCMLERMRSNLQAQQDSLTTEETQLDSKLKSTRNQLRVVRANLQILENLENPHNLRSRDPSIYLNGDNGHAL
eukprot:GILJ01005315.1.p1 GENE.GILJ01005315.1~~GILJ01005315.1.p1  ORF type:complete len:592 (-),score=78.50 GILJ01005315.1:248-2023(-)